MYHKLLFKTSLFLSFTIFIGNQIAVSQNKTSAIFGKVSSADFDLPKNNVVDSNSNAVILADVGSIEFIGNKHNWVSNVFKENIRIKILNKKGYDLATVKIRLYGEGEGEDKIDDFHASTYNIDNGKVVETKLSSGDLFNEKLRKNVNEKKFTMPNVKEGSIIEYSYTITSYAYYYLPGWSFQNQYYPCLYSEFKIGIPNLLRYLTIHYGIDSFYSFKSDDGYKTLLMNDVDVSSVIHNHTWIMKNIPSFKYEDYINDQRDYLDRIEFVLAQTYNGEDVSNIATNWKFAEDELLASNEFGMAVNVENSSNLNSTMKKICSPDGNIMDAAKQIYSYVQDNFTCIPNNDIHIESDLYNVNKLHRGNVAEINMLLVALLRQRGLRADPVILATKDYGARPQNYAILEKMNYVICMIRIGRDSIYLDATDPLLGFGKLPLQCYNGPAQIIDQQHSGSLFFYPNAIKEQNKTYITIVNDENGNGASAGFQSTLGYFASYDLRQTIKGRGQEEYLKKIKLAYGPDVEIANLQIDSLKQPEQPVKINYDINFKPGDDADIIYFDPVMSGAYKENPYKAAGRKFPIEMPYPLDDVYELTMDIPKGYKVDELPKSAKVSFNGNDGFFEYTIQKNEFLVQLHTHIKLNQAIFAAEDYGSLRDFFAYVVKKQSEQIVFKKK